MMSTPRRYELSSTQQAARADHREVLNGICWPLRTASPWADTPGEGG